jgi:hypothetical protein
MAMSTEGTHDNEQYSLISKRGSQLTAYLHELSLTVITNIITALPDIAN